MYLVVCSIIYRSRMDQGAIKKQGEKDLITFGSLSDILLWKIIKERKEKC